MPFGHLHTASQKVRDKSFALGHTPVHTTQTHINKFFRERS